MTYIDEYIKLRSLPNDVIKIFNCSIGRIVLKKKEEGENYFRENIKEINHITDWLVSSCLTEAYWLGRTDEHGRPKKLMKCGSLAGLSREADKDMKRTNQKIKEIEIMESDEELHDVLENGLYIVKLLSEKSLDMESLEMQNCIGHGAYDEKLKNGEYLYLSLRDKNGGRHATMEIKDNEAVQLRGKQNKIPDEKYFKILREYMEKNKISCDLVEYGFIQDKYFKFHNIKNLPDDLHIANYLILSDLDVEFLPKNWTLDSGCLIKNMGNLKEIPMDWNLEEYMEIENCKNVKIHDGEIFKFSIAFKNINNIFPKNMIFEKSVTFSNLNEVLTIYDTWEFRGSLGIRKIKEDIVFPEKIKIHESLYLDEIKNKYLPKVELEVGDIYIADMPNLEEVLFDWKFNGGVSIKRCKKISRLPENIEINGDLTIEQGDMFGRRDVGNKIGNALTVLPDGWHIKGDATFQDMDQLKIVPSGWKIDGNLHCIDCIDLVEIEDLKKFPKNLFLFDCPNLIKIPEDVSLGYLIVNRSEKINYPKNLNIKNKIHIKTEKK